MLDELKSLLNVKVLTKEEQKTMMGGRACCDPINECCANRNMCSPLAACGGVGCNCGNCGYCHSNGSLCGCI